MSKLPEYKTVSVDKLIPYARNSRTHSDEQITKIAASIKEFSFLNPVIVDGENGIIAGHGRVMAAKKIGLETVPVIEASHLTEAQRRAYVIADNRLAEVGSEWDDEMLRVEFAELEELGFDLELTGFDLGEIEALDFDDGDGVLSDAGEGKGSLSDRFLIPPFSVMNAREGWWQDRKRSWLALGIKSEEGRDIKPTNVSQNTPAYMAGRGNNEGGSIFDPVLCEIAYRWFAPAGGLVLDPFAGGSVRGIVAAKLGLNYIGHELRAEQVEANRAQCQDICAGDELQPQWIIGDSRLIDKTCEGVQADFVFSCPPYADLEVYSDDPNDLSTLGYSEFAQAYAEIIKKACDKLKPNSFACFVVGEVRDKKGNYYNFVGDTVQAFVDAGLKYYNEAILVTSAGSLPLRAGKAFSASRKLGKTHQNILVFVKGDGKLAADRCGTVDVTDALKAAEGDYEED